jgi:hypothetical protein
MNTDVATLTARLTAILEAVAQEKRPCKLCGKTCYWIRTRQNTQLVLDADGSYHRQTCPRAPLVAPLTGASQSRMFAPDPGHALEPQGKRR